jgi:DNA-binding transcriptional ArsR family regulator
MKKKKLVVTPLDESKQINQVLANDTARKILDIVSDESLSSSQISKKLTIPLTTVEYNIKRLQDVGLIKVDKKKWSEKGRVVKFYVPQEKFIVIAPKMRRAQVIQTLRKMIPFVGLIAVISVIIEFITRSTYLGAVGFREATKTTGVEKILGDVVTATQASEEVGNGIIGAMQAEPHYGLWFFIIAMIILITIVLINHYTRK